MNTSEIDKKLLEIDQKIDKIDAEISKLQSKRKELKNLKEQLTDKKFYLKSTELAQHNWDSECHPWSKEIREKLKKVFNFTGFREKQLQTINVVLSKLDCLLVSPTGGGKSLCFQLPAIHSNGLTLVVSPLISLMEDQLFGLKKKNINSELLCSTTEKEKVNAIHKILADSSYSCPLKLLYVTPERLSKSKRLMSSLQKCYQFKKLDLIAIDEVHCCSTWGHDFRPDYKFLGTMKMIFPQVPILGVTATASPNVLRDVQKILNIRDCLIFNAPFNRPNLYYHVLEKPAEKESNYDLLEKLLKNRYAGQSGIIYTFSIKDTEELTSELLQRDVKVRPYHANLEPHVRSKVYNKWMSGEIQAVVATVAFGMGIDKPDVRFVIHHTLSKSIENFYQESGRAGRDNQYAECVLLYRFSDIFKTTTMTFTEANGLRNSYAMIQYCISNGKNCRRDIISKYFSEVWNDNDCSGMCDHCFYKDSAIMPPTTDILEIYRTLVKIIDKAQKLDTRLTGLKLIEAWFHKGPPKLRLENSTPPSFGRHYGEQIIAFLIINEYLKEDFNYTAYSTNSYIVKGGKRPNDELLFAGSRVLKLPPIDKIKKSTYDTPSQKKSPQSKKRKIIISSSEDEEEQSTSTKSTKSNESFSSLKSDNIKNIDNEKVDSSLDKYFREQQVDGSSGEDDCIIVTPNKDNIISID